MSFLFHTLISNPLYNGFIFLLDLLPFADAGIVIIIFTILIKLILLPLSIKASQAQLQMKSVENDLAVIKEKYKNDKEEQSRQTIEYYKEKGINPFAGIFILLIQLPIIIGLYQVFLKSGLPKINNALLYSFVSAPVAVNMIFLGLINIAEKSIFLAIIAGVSTYIQISISTTGTPAKTGFGMQKDIASAMAMQMKYFFPVLVLFISYSISSAVALYWITSNVFAILQEVYIKKKYHRTPPLVIN